MINNGDGTFTLEDGDEISQIVEEPETLEADPDRPGSVVVVPTKYKYVIKAKRLIASVGAAPPLPSPRPLSEVLASIPDQPGDNGVMVFPGFVDPDPSIPQAEPDDDA